MRNKQGEFAWARLTNPPKTKQSAELELEHNPLIINQTAKTVTSILEDMFFDRIRTLHMHPFRAETANDPALDAGDTVELSGGSVDVGLQSFIEVITHNVWRYRRKQEIVNASTVPIVYDDAIETAAVSAFSLFDDAPAVQTDEEELAYVQPATQSGKTSCGINIGASDMLAAAGYQAGARLKFSGQAVDIYDKNGRFAGAIRGFGENDDFQIQSSTRLIMVEDNSVSISDAKTGKIFFSRRKTECFLGKNEIGVRTDGSCWLNGRKIKFDEQEGDRE